MTFRPNSYDWRWSVSRLGDFQVQRRQNCSVDDWELGIQRTYYTPDQVYDWIRDEESAKAVGWNIKATKEAIQKACVPLYASNFDVEQWQRDAKDNSLWWSQGKAKQVELRHFWVKEFDGTVSHYITSPDNDKDFLFEKKGRYNSPCDAIVLFTYGVGNMDLYSVRGLGWKLFGSEQLLNVVKCKAANLTMKSMGVTWQASTENGMEDFQSITYGDDTIAPSGFTMTQIQWPNLTNSAIPLINMLASQQQANTGTYTPSPTSAGNDVEKTAKQYEGEAAQQAILSTSAVDLFYQAFDRVDQMTVRALIAEDYPRTMPGGKERWEFITRLLKRGLTMEEIRSVDCVRHVRAIGAGSEAMKRAKLGQLQALSQFMDPQGQRAVQRAVAVDLVGVDNADAFLPAQGERVPDDKKIAELEAPLFTLGVVPEVTPKENDLVHVVQEHYPFVDSVLGKLGQGQMAPQAAIEQLGAALEHCQAHIKKMSQGVPEESSSPGRQAIKAVSIKQQQYEAQLQKITQNFQAQQQAQQEQQQNSQQALSAEQMDQQRKDLAFQADQKRQQEAHEANIAMMQARTSNDILTQRAKVNQHLESADAKTHQQLQADSRKTDQQLASNDILLAQDVAHSGLDNSTPSE